MGHTFYNQFVHTVFATDYPNSLILEDCRDSLYAYITGIVKEVGGQLIARAGTSDHIHLLLNIPTHCSISDLLGKTKGSSSKWFRQKNGNLNFGWSEGFAAFTVSPESINNVKQYFASENKRHLTYSVHDELGSFLNIQEISYKPQYLTKTTYTRLIYHLIWSVKNREPVLDKAFQNELHTLIHKEIQKQKGNLYAVGNVNDHIHLVVKCPGKLATADLVGKLKTTTTNFIRSQHLKLRNFSWQEGYGVFSVGKPALENVIAYVNNQEQHHKIHSFDDEWKKFVDITKKTCIG